MRTIYLLFPVLFLFSIHVNSQAPCLENFQISVVSASLGSPLTGPFQPNEEIEIDFLVQWNAMGCNWLHGLSPTFGDGWSAASFDTSGAPTVLLPFNLYSNSNGNPGNFLWYSNQEVTYKIPGSPDYLPYDFVPAGWYATATSPGTNNPCAGEYYFNPNCSCGITQICNSSFAHQMRILLKTGSVEDCASGLTDLSVHFQLFSDIETGSGTTPVCTNIPLISQSYLLDCTASADLVISSHETELYNNGNLELDFTNFVAEINPDVSYQWRVEADPATSGFSDCDQNCGTIISHQLSNADLYQTKNLTYFVNAVRPDGTTGPTSTFSVKVHPNISLTTYYDSSAPVCSGVTAVSVESMVYGGSRENEEVDYLHQWNTGQTSATITVFPEGTTTYQLTVTDQLGTTQSSSVTVEVMPVPAVTWDTPFEPTYCADQEYTICVESPENNSSVLWDAGTANLTVLDDPDCVSVRWEDHIENPYICAQTTSPEGCAGNELCHEGFMVLSESQCLTVASEDITISATTIFPNPSAEWVTIKGAALQKLEVANAAGQLIWSKQLSGEDAFQLDIRDFANGIYYVLVNENTVSKMVVLR